MGRENREICISCSVSRHNSPRDKRDDALVDLLLAEILLLIDKEEYKPISPWVI